jgi:small GTP-binding protein
MPPVQIENTIHFEPIPIKSANPFMSSTGGPVLKIILLGDSAVGKSTILVRFTEDKYMDTAMTVGVDFKTRDVILDGSHYRLQIWDTAGQEKFRGIVQAYYRKAQGILLIYDQSCSSSFDSLPGWLKSIQEHAAPNVPVVVVGNKSDLEQVVSFERVNAFVEGRGLSFVATSAAQGMGIEDAFMELAKLIVAREVEAVSVIPKEVDVEQQEAAQGGCSC